MDRTTRRLVVALCVSLGLNLFGAGFVVARRVLQHRHGEQHGAMLGPRGFLGRAGLRDAGPNLQRIVGAKRDQLRAQRAGLRAARDEVRAALVQEPFDRAKLEAALAKLRAETTQMQATMHQTLVELAASLDAPQRKHLAQVPWLLHPRPP